jgi:spore coat protein U domain-containing protein, fimbrial subunit CupE1/2/3/6
VKWIKGILTVMFVALAANSWGACTVSSSPVGFGDYNIFSNVPMDAVGSVTISCDPSTPPPVPYTVTLDAGANSGGVFVPRKLARTGGGYNLNYNLYRNATRTEVWGDGTNGSFTVTGSLSASSGVLTVYGRIPAKQLVGVGNYTDTVTVTVLY